MHLVYKILIFVFDFFQTLKNDLNIGLLVPT